MWDLVPWPGIEPGPLHWQHGVLATGPPGKSLFVVFTMVSNYFVGIFLPTSDLEIKYITLFKIDALLGSNFGEFISMEIIRPNPGLSCALLFCFDTKYQQHSLWQDSAHCWIFSMRSFQHITYYLLTLASVKIFHVHGLGIWLLSHWGHFVDFMGFLQRRSKGCIMFQYITL